MSAKKKQRIGGLASLVLLIAALPGVGISTLLLLLHGRKRKPDAAPTNERGQYK